MLKYFIIAAHDRPLQHLTSDVMQELSSDNCIHSSIIETLDSKLNDFVYFRRPRS